MASGFDDLYKTLDSLGNVGKKASKKILTEQAKKVVDQQKVDAPKNSENSYRHLEAGKVKSKGNTSFVKVGITKENWDKCKQLYYQHYGYTLWLNGKYYNPNFLWMDKSFKKIESKILDNMYKDLEKELDRILN